MRDPLVVLPRRSRGSPSAESSQDDVQSSEIVPLPRVPHAQREEARAQRRPRPARKKASTTPASTRRVKRPTGRTTRTKTAKRRGRRRAAPAKAAWLRPHTRASLWSKARKPPRPTKRISPTRTTKAGAPRKGGARSRQEGVGVPRLGGALVARRASTRWPRTCARCSATRLLTPEQTHELALERFLKTQDPEAAAASS